MGMLPRLLFALTLVIAPALIFATSGALPERVATHFGMGGAANGWMSREGYLWFMVLFAIFVPLIVVATSGFVPQFTRPRWKKAALHARAADPADSIAAIAWRRSHACWLGCALAVFLTAMHLLLVEANLRTPAQLPEGAFFGVLGILLAVVGVWSLALKRHLRRVH